MSGSRISILAPMGRSEVLARKPAPGAHVEGLVILEIMVMPASQVETARIALSSGHKGLDDYTADWVGKRWKFPPGEKRWFHWPVAYMMK